MLQRVRFLFKHLYLRIPVKVPVGEEFPLLTAVSGPSPLQNLCHSHSDEATIQQKISTIINCFISSSMPPALQVDVPPEQAQQILKKRRELGPYIFREAQVVRVRVCERLFPVFVVSSGHRLCPCV